MLTENTELAHKYTVVVVAVATEILHEAIGNVILTPAANATLNEAVDVLAEGVDAIVADVVPIEVTTEAVNVAALAVDQNSPHTS